LDPQLVVFYVDVAFNAARNVIAMFDSEGRDTELLGLIFGEM